MAKPDTPGELRDVDVQMVSLVGAPANQTKFAIYKSQDYEPKEVGNVKDKEGFFEVCKKFFLGEQEQEAEKGALKDAVNATDKRRKLGAAIEGLQEIIFWGKDSLISKGDWSGIKSAAVEFASVVSDIADSDDVIKEEAALELMKAGKKICGKRMQELKTLHENLGKLISEAETEEAELEKKKDGGVCAVTKEEMQAVLKEALEPVTTRLETLEKAQRDTNTKEPGDDDKGEAEAMAEIVKEAVAPILQRLEAVEKVRGVSNKLPEEKDDVKKSDIWGGAFLGMDE